MTVFTGVFMALTVCALVIAGLLLSPVPVYGLLSRLLWWLIPLYLLAWFLLHGRRRAPGWERLQGVRYAHRGWHDAPAVPENSLAAFRRAAGRGFGAELDVHLTRDGRLAVIHDSSLERTCGVTGLVEEFTAAELSALRLEGTAEPIPFLEEVLPLFEGVAPLIVELKPSGRNWNALAEKTMDCLDQFQTDYCLESFDPRCLLWLRRNRPDVLRGQLSQNFGRSGDRLNPVLAFGLTNLLCNFCTRPDFVAYQFTDRRNLARWLCCRHWGVRSAYWTIRSAEDLTAAEAEGALAIFEHFDPEEGPLR